MDPQDGQPPQPRRPAWPPPSPPPAPAAEEQAGTASREPLPASLPAFPPSPPPWLPGDPPAPPPEPAEAPPPAGGEATPRRRERRIPWKRLAVLGGVLATLGVFTIGTAMGWALGTRSAADPRETTTEVIAAPTDAGGGVPVLPDVRGLLLVDAQQAVVDAGLPLDVVRTTEAPSALAAGTVLRQDPVGGTTQVSTVTLYVSVPGTVPDLVGASADVARTSLLELGAQFEQEPVFDPAADEGTVLALDPPPGSPLAGTITVTVAGPATSIFLAELDSIEGGCSPDTASINGADFPNSLVCSTGSYESTTTYLVDRVTTSLDMTVGLTDESDVDVTARMVVLADGRAVAAVDVGYGQSREVSVPTTNVLRLEIRHSASGDGSGRLALGNARVTGSAEGISSLDQE